MVETTWTQVPGFDPQRRLILHRQGLCTQPRRSDLGVRRLQFSGQRPGQGTKARGKSNSREGKGGRWNPSLGKNALKACYTDDGNTMT